MQSLTCFHVENRLEKVSLSHSFIQSLFFFFLADLFTHLLFISEFCPLHLVEEADIGPDY